MPTCSKNESKRGVWSKVEFQVCKIRVTFEEFEMLKIYEASHFLDEKKDNKRLPKTVLVYP